MLRILSIVGRAVEIYVDVCSFVGFSVMLSILCVMFLSVSTNILCEM